MATTETTTRTYRASSMPLLMACARAADAPEIRIEGDRNAAIDGQIKHGVIARFVRDGTDHRFADSDLQIAWNSIKAMWKDISQYFPDPMPEQELEAMVGPIRVTGHADIVSVFECNERTEIRVLDWKTGRKQSDFRHQLRTYALFLWKYFAADRVTIMVGWVQDMEIESETFDAVELAAHESDLIERLAADNPPYSTGPHCAYCPRRHECPARQAAVHETAKALMDEGGPECVDIRALPPEHRRDFYGRLKMVAQLAADGLEMFRTEAKAGGPIDIGEGRQLEIVAQDRREIVSDVAMPLLRERFGQEALDPICKLSVGAVDTLAADKAPKGTTKKAAKENLNSLLIERGALQTKTVLMLKETAIPLLEIETEKGI